MAENELAPHWLFAFACAVHALEQDVWEFDAANREVDRRGHSYVDVAPEKLVRIVDGFLEEREKLFKGDVTRLEQIRHLLVTHIDIIYKQGQENARQHWTNATPARVNEMIKPGSVDFRKMGKELAPRNLSASDTAWFIEGFSRQWQQEWVEHFGKTLKN